MLKRLIAIALVATSMSISMSAASAGQAAYPPLDNSLTVNDSTVVPGQSVVLTAKSFSAGTPVTFTIFSAPVVLGTANANGEFIATLTASIPCVPAGIHTIEATGASAEDGLPLTVSTEVRVGASSCGGPTTTTGGGPLPRTGSDSTLPLTQLGLAAVATGGLLVLVARRRRPASA